MLALQDGKLFITRDLICADVYAANDCKCCMFSLWCQLMKSRFCMQVIDVCRSSNPTLVVKRARFSALILRDLQHAVNNLVEPNEDDSKAVDARQEIDLRIGASFTRFQTLLLQVRFYSCPHHKPCAC